MRATSALESAVAMGVWTIELEDGRRFEATESESLLDAARRAGFRVPFGCHHGACRTCAGQLLAGRVAMPAGSALKAEQAKQGFVLTCVTQARSDLKLRVGERIGLLPVLPWTE